ncbi:MAG: hypothetical protein HPY61_14120 [Methanotrichaceae archaeon]|nr:hypothetical protein [Methanotrichaceae archaeon]
MSRIAKAIGTLLILIGCLAAIVGVLVSMAFILPGIIAWFFGTITLCIGLLIGWPEETRAWLVKNRAQGETRKRIIHREVDAETKKAPAHNEG